MVQTRSLFNEMVDVIKQKKDLGLKVYEFQELIIDNITFLYEIYFEKQLFIIKCKNIFVLFDNDNKYSGRYIVHHKFYDNFKELLFYISSIHTHFKIFNGIFLNSQQIKQKVIEQHFFQHSLNFCSICFEQTNETTICKHYICLKCRENMILREQFNCPICRKNDVIQYFSNDINDIYNLKFDELNFINNNEIIKYIDNNPNNPINQHIHLIDVPTIMNLIIIREIITNTTSYPIRFTINIYNFFSYYSFPIIITIIFFSIFRTFIIITKNNHDEEEIVI